MSVLIKGIHIPTGCAVCFYNRDTRCLLLPGSGCDETNGAQRRENCPIIELPDHGDLIDRDRLHHDLKAVAIDKFALLDDTYLRYLEGLQDAEELLLGATAVIPAERSEG